MRWVFFSRRALLLFLLWTHTVARRHLPLWKPQLLLDAHHCERVFDGRSWLRRFPLTEVKSTSYLRCAFSESVLTRRWCLAVTSSLTGSSACTTCVSTRSSSASVSKCFQSCASHTDTRSFVTLHAVFSPSQWRTWNETTGRYRSLTSCPKTSWRSSTNPTKHQRERTEEQSSLWAPDATQNIRLELKTLQLYQD